LYLDIIDEIEAINHKTKEKAVIKFHGRGWSTMSYITGQIFDSQGTERYTITGSWVDKIMMVDSQTKEEFVIYQEDERVTNSN
jgi:hypothetical protein